MNYIGLWLRIVSLIIIMCLAGVISYICLKKTLYVKWVVPIVIVLFFTFSIFKVSQAIIKPSIETFIGKYHGFLRQATSINFFSLEYCFEVGNQKKYVDSDSISANILYPNGMEEGEIYAVSYETKENIVVSIKKVSSND